MEMSYTIELLETTRRAQHFFQVGVQQKDVKLLWKKTYQLSLSEEELKAILKAKD
jgi:hypothetical protein